MNSDDNKNDNKFKIIGECKVMGLNHRQRMKIHSNKPTVVLNDVLIVRKVN